MREKYSMNYEERTPVDFNAPLEIEPSPSWMEHIPLSMFSIGLGLAGNASMWKAWDDSTYLSPLSSNVIFKIFGG